MDRSRGHGWNAWTQSISVPRSTSPPRPPSTFRPIHDCPVANVYCTPTPINPPMTCPSPHDHTIGCHEAHRATEARPPMGRAMPPKIHSFIQPSIHMHGHALPYSSPSFLPSFLPSLIEFDLVLVGGFVVGDLFDCHLDNAAAKTITVNQFKIK